MSRCQITLIAILCILIMIGVIFLIIPKHKEREVQKIVDISEEFIAIERCARQVVDDGIRFIFLNGGSYHPKDPVIPFVFILVPLDQAIASKDTIRNEIIDYVKDNIENCLEENEKLVIKGPPTVQVSLGIKTEIIINWPIVVMHKGQETSIPMIDIESDLPVNKMFIAASQLNDVLSKNNDSIPYTQLLDIATDNNIKIDQAWNSDGVALYSLIIETGISRPLIWNTAHRYMLKSIQEEQIS